LAQYMAREQLESQLSIGMELKILAIVPNEANSTMNSGLAELD